MRCTARINSLQKDNETFQGTNTKPRSNLERFSANAWLDAKRKFKGKSLLFIWFASSIDIVQMKLMFWKGISSKWKNYIQAQKHKKTGWRNNLTRISLEQLQTVVRMARATNAVVKNDLAAMVRTNKEAKLFLAEEWSGTSVWFQEFWDILFRGGTNAIVFLEAFFLATTLKGDPVFTPLWW